MAGAVVLALLVCNEPDDQGREQRSAAAAVSPNRFPLHQNRPLSDGVQQQQP